MNTQLTLNVAPLAFEDAQVEVGILPYKGKQQLAALRSEYQGAYFLRRDGEEITCVARQRDASLIGDSRRTIRLSAHPYLCAALAREALVSLCFDLGRPSPTFDPIRIPSSGENLLKVASEKVNCPDWLVVRTRFLAATRVMSFGSDTVFPAVTLDVDVPPSLDISCAELFAQGFDLQGLYVGCLDSQPDKRLAKRFRGVGRVCSVNGEQLLLVDTRDESDSLELSKAVLDLDSTAFDRCLTHIFANEAGQVRRALEARLVTERNGANKLAKLRNVAQRLTERRLELVPGVTFRLEPFLSQRQNPQFGLNLHGPYTSQHFTPNRPRVCVICQKHRKGQVEQFLHKFREGIQTGKEGKGYFEKGFVRKYALDGIGFEFFVTDGSSGEAYGRAANRAIQEGAQGGKWDLAMVQTEERFHELHGDANPYLVTKAAFLTQQISSQSFEIETASQPEGQLSFSLNNMALATYAKLNGIPWLIKGTPGIAHEFVVGLGSTYVQQGKLGERERLVGITTVFKGDGNYFLSNLSQAVPYNDYKDTLLDSLRRTVTKVRQDMNWQPRENVRIVFHAFKPMRYAEVDAVRDLMKELGDYDVEYAFLHIMDHHGIALFDEKQLGMRDPRSGQMKGVMTPPRGLFFPISETETLVALTGPRELKRPEDGMPRPTPSPICTKAFTSVSACPSSTPAMAQVILVNVSVGKSFLVEDNSLV